MHAHVKSLLALNLFLFSLFGWGVMTNQPFLTGLDEWGRNMAAVHKEQPSIQTARFFSVMSSYKVCLTTGFIVSFLFIYLNKYRTSFFILFGAACTKLISAGLKDLFSRARPPVDSFASVHGDAFPSAHMIYAVFLLGSLYFLISLLMTKGRTILLLCGFLVVGMVSWSRLHLGVHYLSDVLGGFLIGVGWLLVLYLLSEKNMPNDD